MTSLSFCLPYPSLPPLLPLLSLSRSFFLISVSFSIPHQHLSLFLPLLSFSRSPLSPCPSPYFPPPHLPLSPPIFSTSPSLIPLSLIAIIPFFWLPYPYLRLFLYSLSLSLSIYHRCLPPTSLFSPFLLFSIVQKSIVRDKTLSFEANQTRTW